MALRALLASLLAAVVATPASLAASADPAPAEPVLLSELAFTARAHVGDPLRLYSVLSTGLGFRELPTGRHRPTGTVLGGGSTLLFGCRPGGLCVYDEVTGRVRALGIRCGSGCGVVQGYAGFASRAFLVVTTGEPVARLLVMQPDGSERRVLLRTRDRLSRPSVEAWRGEEIAVVATGRRQRLLVVPTDGPGARTLASFRRAAPFGPTYGPSWYTESRGTPHVLLHARVAGRLRVVSVDPDGTQHVLATGLYPGGPHAGELMDGSPGLSFGYLRDGAVIWHGPRDEEVAIARDPVGPTAWFDHSFIVTVVRGQRLVLTYGSGPEKGGTLAGPFARVVDVARWGGSPDT
ncbi:MAG: hypothetical protein R3C15_14885 [Thermoleophilia bacterium]